MSAKQDRQGVRTAADIERKYPLGKTVTEGYVQSAVRSAVSALAKEVSDSVNDINGKVEKDRERLSALEQADKDINSEVSELAQADVAINKAIDDMETSIGQMEEAVSDLQGDVESTQRTANEAAVTANGVASDISTHFAFEEGGTRILGAVVPMLLPVGTDLDGVLIPNKYVSGSVAVYEYVHCPITTGTFSLEVESVGNEGQLLQRLTYSHKTEGKTFERVLDSDGWGTWVLVSDYAWASVETVEDEADTLEDAFNKFKSDTNTAITTISTDVNALEKSTQELDRDVQEMSIGLQGVMTDVYDRFSFVEGGTTIKGGIIPMVIPQGADLDGLMIPNKYTGGNVAEYQYLNCPITSGTFILEVEACGDAGQLLQRLTYGHKTNGKTYERVFYSDGWGGWVLVADYAGAALKAIQADVDALEGSLNKHKTDTSAWMQQTEGDISALERSVNDLDGDTQTLDRTVQIMAADLQGVINDVNNHFDFNEGGMTIKGGINPILIPAGTDLDGLMIPNKYVGGTVTEYNYLNCPVPSGTFLLNVESCGDEGQLKQSLSYCNKTLGRTYERYHYGTEWGEWVCVTDFVHAESAKLLWSEGVYYMTANQTVNLPEAISAQRNGIVLMFSEYKDGAASDTAIHCFFVPKTQVAMKQGGEFVFTMATSKFAYMATKCVYIHDTKIVGHADNNQTGTADSGVKFTNNRFVLRYVFGT